MNTITSFAPIASSEARVLILGSIPGRASLKAEQYYAHSRNQFWPIICELFAIDLSSDYPAKLYALTSAGIALWDVVRSCKRPSSLDADIDKNSIIANDFNDFLTAHPLIGHVFFNGSAAEQAFKKLVLPSIQKNKLLYKRLPSTSPAHAAMSYQEKLQEWRILQTAVKA